MTIKLDELSCWTLVMPDESLKLFSDSDDYRRIRIDLNVEDQTWVYVSGKYIEKVKQQFIAAVGPGQETIEFFGRGDLEIGFMRSGSDLESQVWLYTAELEPNVSENPDAVSFTEMHQRRARNPELEMMQLIARQNEMRMEEKLARMEALLTKKEEKNDDARPADENEGGVSEPPAIDPKKLPEKQSGDGSGSEGNESEGLPAG